uniref:EF-hand domain-containing protein n=1 Tax=Eptatretus burgeri TaxID=7764 RepID=A0A8C4NM67_EPTBU
MSSKTQQEVMDKLTERHKCFSKQEVKELIDFFENQLDNHSDLHKPGGLDRSKFFHILLHTFDMTEEVIMEGVFKAFAKENCDIIDLNDWVDGMAVFLRGTLEEKIKFCFQVYDSNRDEFIDKEEVCHLLKDTIVPTFPREDSTNNIKNLVDDVFKIMDYDQDKKISFEDFKQSVMKENLLLEAFGPCLPEHQGMLNSNKQMTFFPV